jgi:RNA polymerase sigma-70 factor (ECF subfamily)
MTASTDPKEVNVRGRNGETPAADRARAGEWLSASDAQVIRASIADPTAFWGLFQRHYDSLFVFIARRLGRDAADDLATDVFLEAFAVRARYDQRHPDARPWLFGIAANLVRRHRRSEGRRLRAIARQAGRPSVEHEDDAIDRLDGRAAVPLLAKALASMPGNQREVLLMVAWADLTPDEVARALHIAPGTVRSRLSRARARARRVLREAAVESQDNPGPEQALQKEPMQWMNWN